MIVTNKGEVKMESKKTLAFFMSFQRRRIDNGFTIVANLLFPFLYSNSIYSINLLLKVKNDNSNTMKSFINNPTGGYHG